MSDQKPPEFDADDLLDDVELEPESSEFEQPAEPEGISDVDIASLVGEGPNPLAGPSTDEEALKGIGKHFTKTGKIIGGLVIVCALGIGYYAYHQTIAYDARTKELEALSLGPAAAECKAARAEAPPSAIPACGQVAAELRKLYAELDYSDMRAKILMNLGDLQDAQSIPLLTEALDGNEEVRRAAAWAIAKLGSPVADSTKAKLLQVIGKVEKGVVVGDVEESGAAYPQMVWALALLGETGAADHIVLAFSRGRLQSLDGFDAKVITTVLGPGKLSSDELTGHSDESVRVLVAHALSEAATPEVVAPLGKMLLAELDRPEDKRSAEVIRACAAGLGRTNDASAAQPLFAVLERDPSQHTTVIDALKQSVAAPGLITLLGQTKDATVRLELVTLIAATHDPRAADALAGILGEKNVEMKSAAAFALADLGDRRAAPALFELAAIDEDDATASSALIKLREVAAEEDVDRLLAMLTQYPHRAALVMRALGRTRSKKAISRLEAALHGDDPAAAAIALADIGDAGSYRRVVAEIARPASVDMYATNAAERSLSNEDLLRKRKGAILAAGYFGLPDAFAVLSKVVDDAKDDYELRSMAASAIGMVGTAEQLGTVLDKINAMTDDTTRRYYLQALWQRPQKELAPKLLDLMGSDAPIELRRSAGIAVGYMADPANDERLMAMLDTDNTRRPAAFAILLGGSDAAANKLVQILAQDADLREILQGVVLTDENEWFNLITQEMFENGAVWRRARVARILDEGDGTSNYGYAWKKLLHVLHSGWEGPGGVNARFVREKLYEALASDDLVRRAIVAHAFVDLPERGLLLRARDEGGVAGEAAHAVMLDERRRQQAAKQ